MDNRLNRDDWVRHGLKTLAREGADALRADRLAKTLGVSRGSFYWHFAGLKDYHAAVLEAWREETTEAVIEDLGAGDARHRLENLLRFAFETDAALDRAVRAWAVSSPDAAAAVASVDERRVGYLTTIVGGEDQTARDARARFAYWAYVGRTMAKGGEAVETAEADASEIARLLST